MRCSDSERLLEDELRVRNCDQRRPVVSEDVQSSNRAFICLSHSPFITLPGAGGAGPVYLAAVESAKKFIHGFAPDVVVIFAPDHMNLLNNVRPPFTGILSGQTLAEFGIQE